MMNYNWWHLGTRREAAGLSSGGLEDVQWMLELVYDYSDSFAKEHQNMSVEFC